jgi:beta-phosphoglucomutase-like phosphatase (HAD superfamily)
LGIATTTSPDNVTTLLSCTIGPEAPGWFEVIAAGDVVARKKPAPDIFSYALQALGLGPEACLAIEDSGQGLRSARAAGLRSVLVTLNDYTRDHDVGAASLVLDQLGDPDRPCRVLGGLIPHCGLVDLALLRRLHDLAQGAV